MSLPPTAGTKSPKTRHLSHPRQVAPGHQPQPPGLAYRGHDYTESRISKPRMNGNAATTAAKAFAAEYGVKWPKAAAKITNDLDVLVQGL